MTIEKTNDYFRILYDVKGRFVMHKITKDEASYKLLRVKKVSILQKGIPYLTTHDGRTIRYPDPLIKVNDSVRYDLKTGKIVDFLKFETGNLCMVTGGNNLGRVGVIAHRERHPGSFDIIHIKDSLGHIFATRSVLEPVLLSCFKHRINNCPENDFSVILISLSELLHISASRSIVSR